MTREEIIEARRVKFEEWAITSAWLGLGEQPERHSDGYVEPETETAWLAWNAAHDSLEIELPEKQYVPTGFYGAGEAMSFNDGIDSCRDAIEAQGVKVKP